MSADAAIRVLLHAYVDELRSATDHISAAVVEALFAVGDYQGLTDRHGYQQRQAAVLRLWGLPSEDVQRMRSARWRKWRERQLRQSVLLPMLVRIRELAAENPEPR